ncbi:hypothetical protein [Embleya sp. NPDC020886]|uniref:hypothetical protein n=1 Tax=Embleya sp. NPDC020886 TaxID=3363980 RepID=UPI0037B046C4
MNGPAPTVNVGPSGDPHRPIRVKLPDREPTDMTSDELVALQHEIRVHLLYRVPAPSLGRISNSGG